jgi:hypothetical protein
MTFGEAPKVWKSPPWILQPNSMARYGAGSGSDRSLPLPVLCNDR